MRLFTTCMISVVCIAMIAIHTPTNDAIAKPIKTKISKYAERLKAVGLNENQFLTNYADKNGLNLASKGQTARAHAALLRKLKDLEIANKARENKGSFIAKQGEFRQIDADIEQLEKFAEECQWIPQADGSVIVPDNHSCF